MRPSGSDSRVRRQQQLLLLAGLLLVSLRTTASEEAEIAAAAAAANKAAPAAAVGGSPAAASPPAKGARPSSSSAARARVDPKGEGVAFDVFAAKLGKRLDRQLPKMSHREIFDALDVDKDQKVTDEELKGIRNLVPAESISRAQFTQRFQRGEHKDAPTEVMMKAFDFLDKDENGVLQGEGEVKGIQVTLNAIHRGFQKQGHLGPGKIKDAKDGSDPFYRAETPEGHDKDKRGGATADGRGRGRGRGRGGPDGGGRGTPPQRPPGMEAPGGKRVTGKDELEAKKKREAQQQKKMQGKAAGDGIHPESENHREWKLKAHKPGGAHPLDPNPKKHNRQVDEL